MNSLFLKTNKTHEDDIMVVGGYRRSDGTIFFLLNRIKNAYAKNPLFLVEYSNDTLSKENSDGSRSGYKKLYVINNLSQEALSVLRDSDCSEHKLGLFANKELKLIFGSSFERLNQTHFQNAFGGQIYLLAPRQQ